MGQFHGRFDYSIDIKGRVNIPAKFRKTLSPNAGETFIICRAPDGCLRAYPRDLWENYEAELASRPKPPRFYGISDFSTIPFQIPLSMLRVE